MILTTVILLSSWSLVHGDYKCACNYNVEKSVLSRASANADVIGYMYEFDCKPEAGPSGNDAWLAVAFEHKVGFIEKDPQIQIQTCPGSIPDEDKLPPETTTTTSTVFTTTTTPETATLTISQAANNSISTTAFETTEQPITLTQQPTTMLTAEPTTEPTTESTTETTTETTTELTTELITEPPTEPATMIAITNTTLAETTVLESTTNTATSPGTPDTTTPEQMTSSTKMTTHLPTTFSSTPQPSSSTQRPITSASSTTSPITVPALTYAPTATSVLQGHTELCPTQVIQHSHRTGSILNQYGDKCYEVVQEGVSWLHAESNCRDQGGHLAHIANQQEQDFVYHFLVKIHSHTVWIGLHDRNYEEHFEWTSVDPVTYENWKPGRKDYRYHDNEDCVFMSPDNGQWDDVQCGGDNPLSELFQGIRYAYICQYATEMRATIGPVTVQTGHVSQGVISLCPNPVRQQSSKDNGILGQYNHNCYELIAHTFYPWNYAERICHSRGGHLAHIQNQQEQIYLQGFLQQHLPDRAVWIGLSDQQSEEHFQWSSHDAVVYTNWVPGHTSNFVSHHDEDCVVMVPYKGGQWDDIPCGHETTSLFGNTKFIGEIHPLICQYNTVSGASLVG